MAIQAGFTEEIRSPDVAGQFYPGEASVLRAAIHALLETARPPRAARVSALVVPHAGYVFSGQICADGYNQVRGQAVDAVALLGTNHTTRGLCRIALYPGAGFQTPLGTCRTDRDLAASLLNANPDCVLDGTPHRREHSLEVQVPFLQVVFPGVPFLPLVVGDLSDGQLRRFGESMAFLATSRRLLVVASSDLSHYPRAEDAESVDKATLEAVASLDIARVRDTLRKQMRRRIPDLHTCACGEMPILAAMAAARALGAVRGEIVSYAHSGDAAVGERSRVVGYGAVAFTADPLATTAFLSPEEAPAPGEAGLGEADKKALLRHARETLERYYSIRMAPLARDFPAHLMEPRGVFVTLKKKGRLRGCLGHMAEDTPLATLVGTMALQSALEDPRFEPVTAGEVPSLEIEISVLTPARPVSGPADIVVGRDGVILRKGGRSAVFLPQVAPEQGWGREEMLDHLCLKAGLPAGAWKTGASLSTFQAIVFQESDDR